MGNAEPESKRGVNRHLDEERGFESLDYRIWTENKSLKSGRIIFGMSSKKREKGHKVGWRDMFSPHQRDEG